jgi:putative hydrolase of the HAD superfamily
MRARLRPADHLGHVRTWVFDLDNTLYPPAIDLFTQVDRRITAWIADFHGIDGLSARALQKHYYQRYGTSLNGLMIEDEVDPHVFMDFVHDIDHSAIRVDHRLGEAIAALPGRRYILTNGSRKHAEAISGRLGIDHLFDDMFDIAAAGFVPKPRRHAYEVFLSKFGVDPAGAAMFEDLARNLEVPHALGMRTVLVTGEPSANHHADRDGWEAEGRGEPYIDHVTADLAAFLRELNAPRAPG